MNVSKKQISSGAVINIAGILVGAVLNLWLLPELFSTEELGMYRWMERTAVLLSNILLFGVHRSFTKFHSDPNKDKKAFESAVVGRSTLLMIVVGAVLFIIGPELAPLFNFDKDVHLLRYLSFFVVSGMAFLMAVAAAATTKRIAVGILQKPWAAHRHVGDRTDFIVLRLYLQPVAHCLRLGIIGAGNNRVVIRLEPVKPTFTWRHMGAPMGKDVQKFAWISVFSVLIEIGINTLDVQMLSMLTDMDSVGIYGMAFFIDSVIDGIRDYQSDARSTNFYELEQEQHGRAAQNLREDLQRSNVGQCLCDHGDGKRSVDFLSFQMGKDSTAIPVVGWTLARKYINASFGSNGEIITNSPFYKLNMQIGSIMLVINIVLNFLFIPKYGILGVAYSGLIAVLFVNAIRAIMIYRKSGLQPFTRESLYIFMGSSVVGLVCYALPVDGFMKFILSGLIVLAAAAVSRKFIKQVLLR